MSLGNGKLVYDSSNGLSINGKITSTSGTIGGFTIGAGKIYAGSEYTGVIAMQVPSDSMTYAFAVGGTSHSSYKDCPFRVTKDGTLYADNIRIGEYLYTYDSIYKKYTNVLHVNQGVLYITDVDEVNINNKVSANTVQSESIIMGTSTCRPLVTEKYTCGGANYRWKDVYSMKASNNTSDRNLKHDILSISEIYENLFYKLKPVTYMFNNGDRIHMGFISQDLEDSMNELGLSDLECAAFCKDIKTVYEKDENGNEIEKKILDQDGNPQYIYSIRYGEFIALNTHMIQKLYKENESLKQRVLQLERAMA